MAQLNVHADLFVEGLRFVSLGEEVEECVEAEYVHGSKGQEKK